MSEPEAKPVPELIQAFYQAALEDLRQHDLETLIRLRDVLEKLIKEKTEGMV